MLFGSFEVVRLNSWHVLTPQVPPAAVLPPQDLQRGPGQDQRVEVEALIHFLRG